MFKSDYDCSCDKLYLGTGVRKKVKWYIGKDAYDNVTDQYYIGCDPAEGIPFKKPEPEEVDNG